MFGLCECICIGILCLSFHLFIAIHFTFAFCIHSVESWVCACVLFSFSSLDFVFVAIFILCVIWQCAIQCSVQLQLRSNNYSKMFDSCFFLWQTPQNHNCIHKWKLIHGNALYSIIMPKHLPLSLFIITTAADPLPHIRFYTNTIFLLSLIQFHEFKIDLVFFKLHCASKLIQTSKHLCVVLSCTPFAVLSSDEF